MTDRDEPGLCVQTRRETDVLIITLQREDRRNAIDRSMADAIDAALNLLDDDGEIRCGVLTGGTRVFCAGSDLRSKGDYVTSRGGEYGIIRRRRRKPLVAAVEGLALGGGMEIALACDLVVAADNARFGLPEVMRGVVPTCGALFRAVQALPPNLAREMILTGEPIDAPRAYAAGWVNRLAQPGQALSEALALAQRISANAPLSVQGSLEAMNSWLACHDREGWEATERALTGIRGSEDTQEGIRAFFERRPPVWRGR
ncbi:MAG: enoyl-CoA hydratase-related protein [Porticoccaceae bacterium]